MSSSRLLTLGVLGFRIAYGAALIAVPSHVTRRWLGDTAQRPGGRVALGALGAREVVLHVAGLRAALTGAPVRPWLAASIGGDLTDIAVTTAARSGLPDHAAPATAAVAGASALLSAALVAIADE